MSFQKLPIFTDNILYSPVTDESFSIISYDTKLLTDPHEDRVERKISRFKD